MSTSPKFLLAVSSLIALAVMLANSWIGHSSYSSLEDNEFDSSSIQTTPTDAIHNDDKTKTQWMNSGGLAYGIANAPDFDTEWILKDPTVQFFDAYSKPIRSLYSQVHWTSHGDIPLPDHIIERYDNNNEGSIDTMAVLGYEVDQVRIDPQTGKEVSVPITWAYNHHYMAFLMGKTQDDARVSMIKVPLKEALQHGNTRMAMGHGGDEVWIPGIPSTNTTTSITTLTEDNDRSWGFFSEGNGGEMRKSYHLYPKGYAQLLRKPHSFSVTPMQIDTWNRDTMANTSKFVPPQGNPHDYFPASSSSRIINNLRQANYNPILECPCSDRLVKKSGMTYALVPIHQSNPEPSKSLDNSMECFDAAENLLPSTNMTQRVEASDTNRCEAVLRSDGSLEVVWKTNETTNEKFDTDNGVLSSQPRTARATAFDTRMEIDSNDLIVGSTPTGSIVNATLVLNTTSKMVEITLQGPYLENDENDNEKWFAIGLGANTMCIRMQADECTTGGPYAIVVLPPDETNNQTSRVVERKLDYHGAGRILTPNNDSNYNLSVLSNEIEELSGTKRRVVRLLRPWEGPTSDYYSFPTNLKPLPIILAKGCNERFGQHCGHQSPNPISFARVDSWQEILRDGIEGSIGGKPFHKNCLDEPYGDLIKQHNPTCQLETYQGGLKCCHHDKFLLDTNQTIPWKDQILEYRLKFRFYYQDYVDSTTTNTIISNEEEAAKSVDSKPVVAQSPSHSDLTRFYWVTEAKSGEYDVPECPTPSEPESCVHVITSRWKVQDFGQTGYFPNGDDDDQVGIQLIYAGPHCHAPTCLSMELYNDDTGELLCRVEPLRGQGASEKDYDEAGFLAIPPCLWSHPGKMNDGLLPPVILNRNTTLLSIKRANSTYSHTGEMASWQMRGVFYKSNSAPSAFKARRTLPQARRLRQNEILHY